MIFLLLNYDYLLLKYYYLRRWKEITNIEIVYSSWQEVLYGFLKGSILRLLLFTVDLCNIFLILNQYDIANYAHVNALCVSGRSIEEVVASLENVSETIFQWFRGNRFQGIANVMFY